MDNPIENEVGILPALTEPNQMSNDELAAYVRDGLKKLSAMVPYVKELKARFSALPRGKANIMGCHTWKEFCETVLGRTDSAVRKALAQADAEPKKARVLLEVLRFFYQTRDRDEKSGRPIVRFSVGENGNVLATALQTVMVDRATLTKEEKEYASWQLDVKAPTADDFKAVVTQPGRTWDLLGQKVDQLVMPGHILLKEKPFDVRMYVEQLIDRLELMDGEPTIWLLGGPKGPFLVVDSDDGELHFYHKPEFKIGAATEEEETEEEPPVSDKERQRAEAKQQKAEARRKEQEKQEHEENEFARKAGALFQELPQDVRVTYVPVPGKMRVRITIQLTLEQLEQIRDALQASTEVAEEVVRD